MQNDNLTQKVCLYLRKSRADQEAEARGEMETLARHEKILLELAKKRSYHIGAIYKELVSGETIASRPVMQQLLIEVESGAWDGVLVVEVERLARGDSIDQGIIARAFQCSNTMIITPAKTYDPNNEFDEEYFEFGLFMSRREYKTIRRRMNAGRLSSVREGKYVGNKPPYGYVRVKLTAEKGYTLEPLPEQAEVVRLIYDLYVNGFDGDQMGVGKIVRHLNNLHIPSQNRASWVPSSIMGILGNPVYAGKVVWNRRKSVKRIVNGKVMLTRPRATEYDIYPGKHPAIISEEIWNKAQIIRQKNPPRPANSLHTVRNPLSGIVVCSMCGRKMVRRPLSAANKEILMCPYTDCPNVSHSLPVVEQTVIDCLQEIVDKYRLNSKCNCNPAAGQNILDSLIVLLDERKKELSNLEMQKRRQYDLLEQGIYSTEIFLERSADISRQLSDVQENIQCLEKQIDAENKRMDNRERFIPKCEYLLAHYWEWDASTKNDVLKELIEKVVYTKTKKNSKKDGDLATFKLEVYPKVP